MGIRLPAKAGEIVDGDVAAWALVDRAAEAAGECLCESPCSLPELLGSPKGPIPLSEIRDCPALSAEFDPRELVECYCLISASLGTVPSLDSIMDTEDQEVAEATSFEEWAAARAKGGRAFEERQQKMLNLYSTLVKDSLSS